MEALWNIPEVVLWNTVLKNTDDKRWWSKSLISEELPFCGQSWDSTSMFTIFSSEIAEDLSLESIIRIEWSVAYDSAISKQNIIYLKWKQTGLWNNTVCTHTNKISWSHMHILNGSVNTRSVYGIIFHWGSKTCTFLLPAKGQFQHSVFPSLWKQSTWSHLWVLNNERINSTFSYWYKLKY